MKALIILSGGLDSTTLLYDLLNEYHQDEILALSFNYGSKHNEYELAQATKTCKELRINHTILDLKSLFDNLDSALLDHDNSEAIPEGHYADENMKKTVVPFRNGILLSIAVGIAESRNIPNVYFGAHAGDHAIYPDCRKVFIKAVSKCSQLGTYNKIKISAPYKNLDKIDIVERGKKLGVNYSMTWTCYNPTKDGLPCGKCGSCVERTEAFFKNQLSDPLYNEVGWNNAIEYLKSVEKK